MHRLQTWDDSNFQWRNAYTVKKPNPNSAEAVVIFRNASTPTSWPRHSGHEPLLLGPSTVAVHDHRNVLQGYGPDRGLL